MEGLNGAPVPSPSPADPQAFHPTLGTIVSVAHLTKRYRELTVSIRLQGEYDIDNVTLSVPCLVAAGGIERIIDSDLADNELEALKKSAAVLRKTLDDLDGASPE